MACFGIATMPGEPGIHLQLKRCSAGFLSPEDDRLPARHPVAVLSHGFWVSPR